MDKPTVKPTNTLGDGKKIPPGRFPCSPTCDACKLQKGTLKAQSTDWTESPGMLKLRAANLYLIPLPFDLKPLPVVPPRDPSHDPAKL